MKKHIDVVSLSQNTFNQLEYFEYFDKLIDKNIDYDASPLEKFYLRIF